jgi:hypothetical protein
MPYKKRKIKCKQADGDRGNYVLTYTDKKGKRHRACHTSKKKMQGQIAAIEIGESTMKIATGKLKQIIQEELTSLTEQGLSASRMSQGDNESENMALVLDVIMLGLEAYTSGKMSKEDELEYSDDVQSVLERNVPVTKSIADIVRELELEGSRQGSGSGAPPGSPLDDFDEAVEEALEDFPVSAAEGQVSAKEVARDIIMVKVGPEQYTKRGRPSWVEKAVKEHGEDFIMTRAVGAAKDFGYE